MRREGTLDAAMATLTAVKDTNKFLTDMAPWHIKADEANGVSEADADLKRQVLHPAHPCVGCSLLPSTRLD